MDWNLKRLIAVAFIITFLHATVNARPGIRNPPARFLVTNNDDQEMPTVSTSSSILENIADEVPLVTNRRYLEQNVVNEVNQSRPHLEPVSEAEIFSEYKSSSNFIINEFLKKNIQVLLSDSRLPRRLPLDDDRIRENNYFDKNEKEEKSYPETRGNFKKIFVKNNQKIRKVITNWNKKYHNNKYNTNDIKSSFPLYVETSSEPNGLQQQQQDGKNQERYPVVIITSRPVGNIGSSQSNGEVHENFQYQQPTRLSSNKNKNTNSHHTVVSDQFYSSTLSTHPNNVHTKIPSTYPYDPADPDPFYDLVSDLPGLNDQAQNLDSYGSLYVDGDSDVKSELLSNDKTDAKCPGVKVTLNDNVSLNIQSNDAPCNAIKLNSNGDDSNEGTTVKSNTVPDEISFLSEKTKPSSSGTPTILHSASTQLIPLLAQIPATSGTHSVTPQISQGAHGVIPSILGIGGGGAGGGGGGHDHNKHKHKHGHKKPSKHHGLTTGVKYMAVLFAKFFALFTIANPLSFSFWIMMFSPLAVLLAGGAGLAMVLYPFASAVLTHAYHPNKRSPSTIVVHRHRYAPVPKWKRLKSPRHRPVRPLKPWGHLNSWRRIGSRNAEVLSPESRQAIPISQAHIDEVDNVVKMSINNFRQMKNR